MKNRELNTTEKQRVLSDKPLKENRENEEVKKDKNFTFFQKVKEEKLFYKKDLVVYFSLFLLIVLLFVFLVFPTLSKKDNTGFNVSRNGQTVLTFNAKSSEPFSISIGFENQVEIENSEEGIYRVKIYSSAQKNGYNILLFNAKKISVKVIESTCSDSKDCTFCPELKNSGSIYCAPHTLKITPLSGGGFVPPTTG